MRWEAGVGGVVAVAVLGLWWLAWPAAREPVSFQMVQSQVEVSGATLSSTTFVRLPEQRARTLRETLTKGIADCWVAPPPALAQDNLAVRIQVQLEGSGRVLSTKARVPDAPADSLQAMASIAAAERAIRDCQPYEVPDPSSEGLETIFITIDFEPGKSQPPAQ
jgi:hypothetical protein